MNTSGVGLLLAIDSVTVSMVDKPLWNVEIPSFISGISFVYFFVPEEFWAT